MACFSTIGILGGMGPEATNHLCALITALTPVRQDQDHIPVIAYNNSGIPDRVKAVCGETESPLPEMIRTACVLEQAGASLLLMPCNLAHFYWSDVQRMIGIPLLNMIEETAKHTVKNYPHSHTVGIIASTPTIECGLYARAFNSYDRLLLSPEREEQETKVMRAIYGQDGIKCGHKLGPRALLMEAAQGLVMRGAQVIIAGCTEVSLVMKRDDSPFTVIDPMEVLARVAIRKARPGESKATLNKSFQFQA